VIQFGLQALDVLGNGKFIFAVEQIDNRRHDSL
jgi:hypothetical protein